MCRSWRPTPRPTRNTLFPSSTCISSGPDDRRQRRRRRLQRPGSRAAAISCSTQATSSLDVSTDPPTVLPVGGPHPQFFGDVDALCAYLAGYRDVTGGRPCGRPPVHRRLLRSSFGCGDAPLEAVTSVVADQPDEEVRAVA